MDLVYIAKYPDEETAGLAYRAVAELLKKTPADLSAYRFQLNAVYHIGVVGDPAPKNEGLLMEIAAAMDQPDSEVVDLPAEVTDKLLVRHRQIMKLRQPWLEAHYPDGMKLQ